MGLYKNTSGVLTPIAGRGKAEYGASTVRKGTLNVPVNQATGGIFIEFDTPLPDNDYIVSWEFDDCADGDAAHIVGPHYKYATGFGLYYFGGFTKDVRIKWTAFKLYTDNQYNELLTLPTEVSRVDHLYDHSGTIASNDDLNDYIVPGNYLCNTAAICNTLSNKPSSLNQGFSLKVEVRGAYSVSGTSTIFQTVYKVNNNAAAGNNDCPVYVRSRAYNISTWSNWKRLVSTSDLTYIQQSLNGPAIAAGRTEIILDIANVPSGHKLLAVAGYELGRELAIHSYGAYIYSNNPSTRTFKVRLPLYADEAISQLNGHVDVLTCPAD